MKANQQMRILAVCETLDYQNFTRRATFDAIAKAGNLDALCHTSAQNIFRTNLKSEHTNVYCYYRLLPHRFYDVTPLRQALRPYEHWWKRFFDKYDAVIITSPLQAYLLDFCRKKVIYLLSDPYHLMGYQYEDEKRVLQAADIVLATSRNLRDVYLPRYFRHEPSNVFYWPNTADLALWDYTKNPRKECPSEPPIIGFAGNFMKIVDLELLDLVTDHFGECSFRMAGKISCANREFRDRLERIFAKPNVAFLGFIPFNDLPREVAQWDICLMLDDLSELSSYHHHNKLYQYLALGKSVVIQRNHGDYDALGDVIYLAQNPDEFIAGVKEAFLVAADETLYRRRIDAAQSNSSTVRAREFIETVTTELHQCLK